MIDLYNEEISDLTKAYAATSLAFGILIFKASNNWILAVLVATITVGLGFLLHELAHRVVAMHYRKHAIFKANDQMLIISIIAAILTPIAIAAPGAVHIYGHHISRKENGIISAAGPVTNIALAIIFLAMVPLFPVFAFYGFMINAWLAIFNLMPITGFDGEKVLEWSKPWYFGIVAVAVLLNILNIILPNYW